MALNDFEITALLTEWEKSEDENDLDSNKVQNTFENVSNVEFIDINNLPIEIANINGEFVSIPFSNDIAEPCLSIATSDENINNIANIAINKNILSSNSRALRSHNNVTSHFIPTISQSQTSSQGQAPSPNINPPIPANILCISKVQQPQKPVNLKWKKGNLITNDVSLVHNPVTLPTNILNFNSPLQFFSHFFTD
ncbi:uncharacterized protein LOC112591238, partial [Melanaphis sacchari]|uniref:uncharacterized protein LOC112591238 n=1 Tax=Melanaphis sacchari TaxID=742174 RepID=UPI000DC13D5F